MALWFVSYTMTPIIVIVYDVSILLFMTYQFYYLLRINFKAVWEKTDCMDIRVIKPANKVSLSSGFWVPQCMTYVIFLSGEDWDMINNFTAAAGWRILFGLNNQLRRNGQFDPSNAIALLDYSIKKGYAANLDFELGNGKWCTCIHLREHL